MFAQTLQQTKHLEHTTLLQVPLAAADQRPPSTATVPGGANTGQRAPAVGRAKAPCMRA